ncbi:MAG: hypothetical protein ABFR36_07100 [Acidobacteriota bacterium]
MLKKIILSVLSLLLIVLIISAQDIDKTKVRLLDRPDIVVEKMKLTKLPVLERGKVKLKIEVWVSNNSSKPTRCCPTKAGVNWWKQYPPDNKLFRIMVFGKYGDGIYFTAAYTSTELGPNVKNARYQFVAKFKSKYKLNIKVEADPANMINEKNENNNMKRMYWPLRVKIVN